jgi:hypothetical protein
MSQEQNDVTRPSTEEGKDKQNLQRSKPPAAPLRQTAGGGKEKTRPMAPYDAPESGGPLPELDDGPSPGPVDDIQGALVEAAQQGVSTEVEFDELPEPVPDVDEGPRPGPVDDIQEALFEASQQGAPTEVEFDELPEPGTSFPQKIIRFAQKTISPEITEPPQPEADTEPPPPSFPEPEAPRGLADFWLLLVLFLTFRLLTLFLLRPGGFIRDWSDFDTYLGIASLSDYSLYPFLNFWLEWPPLLPWLMVGAYKLSLLLPPWTDDPRLWFILILGSVFVLFEVGNFILIHRLARRLFQSPVTVNRVLWLYAGLFPPVYAMLGFFDGVALFFILLALDLLLSEHPGDARRERPGDARREHGREHRLPSAIAAGVGFVVKIIPVLALPIALRRLWYQHRNNHREAWIEIGLYSVVFGLVIVALFAPFLIAGPEWVLAFIRSMLGRSSWETIWAVLEGYHGFGAVAGSRLNPAETNFAIHEGGLPWGVWGLITLAFAGIYAFIFTRPADYSRPRNLIAFSGLTIAIFMLYAKGYSPQFLVYLLPFILLLFPDGRGLTYALILTGLNTLEQPIYFVLLPGETWLLTFIVIARFIIFLALAVEFALVIWGAEQRLALLVELRQHAPLVLGSLSVLALLILTPLMLQAHADDRLTNSPARTFIDFMQAQAQNVEAPENCQAGPDSLRLFLSNQTTYRELYPYLHHDFDMRLVVGAPEGSRFPKIVDLLPDSGTAWILPTGPQGHIVNNEAAKKGRALDTFEFEGLGTASLYGFPANANLPPCLAPARFSGGIELLTHQVEIESGAVNVTLFWRARSPQTQNLTVFTQLLNVNGEREQVPGHDSIPQNGAAPTTTWTVDAIQLDPHRIDLPANLPRGDYTLVTGLYNDFDARLSSFDPTGASYPDRSVPLEVIQLP